MFRNNLGCISQFLRSLKLSLRVNDLGPPLPLTKSTFDANRIAALRTVD